MDERDRVQWPVQNVFEFKGNVANRCNAGNSFLSPNERSSGNGRQVRAHLWLVCKHTLSAKLCQPDRLFVSVCSNLSGCALVKACPNSAYEWVFQLATRYLEPVEKLDLPSFSGIFLLSFVRPLFLADMLFVNNFWKFLIGVCTRNNLYVDDQILIKCWELRCSG